MKRYLKFAASFWMSAFLIAGSMATAQTTPTAKAKKNGGSPAANTTPTNNTSQAQTGTTTTSSPQTAAPAAVPDQQNVTPSVTKPKTMVSPDKQTIPVPHL